MGNQVPRAFRFEIDNFSEKNTKITSPIFTSGGCEWYFTIYPKGTCRCNTYMCLFLNLANPQSLPTGWKRKARCHFLLLNQSGKVLYKSELPTDEKLPRHKFCARTPSLGWAMTLPYRNLIENGLLEKDKLIVDFYISDVELVDGNGRVVSEKETVIINGFQVYAYLATSARKLFAKHPNIAEDLKPKNQFVKNEYMNVLLNLVETLNKPSQNHSEIEIRNSHSKLSELMEQGFKLDWLKAKLDEVSLKRKKSGADDVQRLDERVKNDLELVKLDLKLDCLKTKLEEVALEKKKSDEADGSRVKEMEGRIKDLEIMVSDLKVELGKVKAKASADDDFLLID
ncbi:PREDICTED: MATH domain and coiled-coil domain-containing protein At2g42480-like [Camelina sativa]|uniref:MATH domain and coiled-coil domain-containing protein At2g42480-like n=1 Tax=Camelina sativa TaxID=90675 RepID=A0ABM1RNX6_CAMSA|nr:PREDICTED: MATH domain and coiled-coil domain-containing protein At2g42480-like [Camelina sativa]